MPTINLGRVGFVNKGTWSIATAYKINDIVDHANGTYAALQANTGQTPVVGGNAFWQEWTRNDNVTLSGDQTVAGIKTFTSSPIVPDATTAQQPLAFGQVPVVTASAIHNATAKTTPVDLDEFGIADSAASFVLKKLTWANLKTALISLFAPINSPAFTGTPTAPTATAGTNTTQLATTAFVKAKSELDSIGVGQTWQDLTASRANNTAYTNSTGKPICVSVTSTTGTSSFAQISVDGKAVFKMASLGNASDYAAVVAIVPDGSAYSVSVGAAISFWYELR